MALKILATICSFLIGICSVGEALFRYFMLRVLSITYRVLIIDKILKAQNIAQEGDIIDPAQENLHLIEQEIKNNFEQALEIKVWVLSYLPFTKLL